MTAINRIKAILGLNEVEADGLTQLRDLLAEREAELSLTAEYGRPHPNMQDKPTVVFPYTLSDQNGEDYGAGAKEFVIPDNGLNDADSALVAFIGKRLGVGPDDVDFEALASVEGTTANAELTESGDVEVAAGAPAATESSDTSDNEVSA